MTWVLGFFLFFLVLALVVRISFGRMGGIGVYEFGERRGKPR